MSAPEPSPILSAKSAVAPTGSPSPGEAASADSTTVPTTEGRHVLHAFYSLDRTAWQNLKKNRRQRALEDFKSATRTVADCPGGQLVLFSCVGPMADLGFIFLADDLHDLDRAGKQLQAALGPGVLRPVSSYLSLTERSEYTTSEEEYMAQVTAEEGLAPDSPEMSDKRDAFRARMAKYTRDRLYPNLPSWPVVCFYPMSKRRAPSQNWYALPFAERRQLMLGHARVGRTYSGRILQLITGSTGLDSMEWGVTLFARSLSEVKAIVYEMRFDPVSAHYADFGDFFIGLQMPAGELLNRLEL
jgi:chlorite dismutase